MTSTASLTLYKGIKTAVTFSNLHKHTPPRRLTEDDLSLVHDAAILVNAKGQIVWVGPARNVPKKPNRTVRLDAELVLPGFVDCHTHLLFAGNRADEFRQRLAGASYEDLAARGGGILTTVNATREATTTDLFKIGKERLEAFARFGVTTVEAKSGYALNEIGEKKLLDVATKLKKSTPFNIIRTYLGAHAFPKDQSREDYLKFLLRSQRDWFKAKLYDQLDMFTEESYFSLAESETLITNAKKNGIPFKIHADEFSALGGCRLGIKHGALSVDHLLHYRNTKGERDIVSEFKNAKTVPVFLPGTAFFLRLPYADPIPLLSAGVPVALATDFNPGSCMTQNILLIMTLAVLHMRLTVEEALAATTVNGARALGLTNVGHLSPGARADFQVYDCDYSNLVYEFGRPLVRSVFLNGKKYF